MEVNDTTMAYTVTSKKSNRTYYLHQRDVTLKNGRQQRIYFFGPVQQSGVIDALPNGFKVDENPRTGLPYLRKG